MNLIKHTSKVALLLVDFQQGFEDEAYWGGNRNNPNAEQQAFQLLSAWREKDFPIVHVRHASTNPHSPLAAHHPGHAYIKILEPLEEEINLTKQTNSAFIGTGLTEMLQEMEITAVVICGLVTNHCVSTTARMAANLGFDTVVVSDATAAFDAKGIDGQEFSSELVHQVSLANLNKEFADIRDTAGLLSELGV